MSDLKPCPFCGFTPEIQYHMKSNQYYVECQNWKCGSKAHRFKEKEACDQWNTRPIEEKLEDIIYKNQEY